MSFLELRSKEVINVVDGRRLGRVCDVILGGHKGGLKGIVVPFSRRFFFKSQDIFIPFECIDKIGEDAILVRVRSHNHHHDKHKKGHHGGGGHHDRGRERERGHGHREHHSHHEFHCEHDRHRGEDCCHGAKEREHRGHREKENHGHHEQREEHCGEHGCHEQIHRAHLMGDCREPEREEREHKNHGKDRPKCDRKCEKCMLFDCVFRWK